MAVLQGHAGRLPAPSGGARPGQWLPQNHKGQANQAAVNKGKHFDGMVLPAAALSDMEDVDSESYLETMQVSTAVLW